MQICRFLIANQFISAYHYIKTKILLGWLPSQFCCRTNQINSAYYNYFTSGSISSVAIHCLYCHSLYWHQIWVQKWFGNLCKMTDKTYVVACKAQKGKVFPSLWFRPFLNHLDLVLRYLYSCSRDRMIISFRKKPTSLGSASDHVRMTDENCIQPLNMLIPCLGVNDDVIQIDQ